jgi:hypothetical protein
MNPTKRVVAFGGVPHKSDVLKLSIARYFDFHRFFGGFLRKKDPEKTLYKLTFNRPY